jgi:hypothetical protein
MKQTLSIILLCLVMVATAQEVRVFTLLSGGCGFRDDFLEGQQTFGSFPINQCNKVTYLGEDFHFNIDCSVTDEMLSEMGIERGNSKKGPANQLLYYPQNCSSTPMVLTTGTAFSTEPFCYQMHARNSPGSIALVFTCLKSTAASVALSYTALLLVISALLFCWLE